MINFRWPIVFIFSFFIVCHVGYAQKKRLKQGKVERLIIMQEKQTGTSLLRQSEEVFDKDGNTIEELNYDDLGDLEGKTRYKYDAFNNLLEKEVHAREKNDTSKAVVLKEKRVYQYNGFNELSEEYVYNAMGALEKKYVYEYNRFQLLTVRTAYNSANKIIQVKKYLYEKF
jgi:hypothetical protein